MKTIAIIITSVILVLITDQYLFCPVYTFTNQGKFYGDSIYNPYSNTNNLNWIQCNFHAHATCWAGITNGEGTANDIHQRYKILGYGVHAVSDYQYIDTNEHTSSNYISSYEHGYNLLKNHQLVLGAAKVCWKDYLLPQSINNKQHIINCLDKSDASGLIVINHPMVRGAYSAHDFTKLTGFRCMEVLNPACNSVDFWDAALTAGHPVFIVGDDDVHNIKDTNKVGNICTWINAPALNTYNIINALKQGKSYGMIIGGSLAEEVRAGKHNNIPALKKINIHQDSVTANFTMQAEKITVSTENGRVLYEAASSDSISFYFDKTLPYARITASFSGGTKIYLNPIFHYADNPFKETATVINQAQTLIQRIAGGILLLLWFKSIIPLYDQIKPKKIIIKHSKQGKYGYFSNFLSRKTDKVRYSRLIRNVNRFFNNLAIQRKNRPQ